MKLVGLAAPLLLLSACATAPSSPEKAPELVSGDAQRVCFEDTPTGTRFTRMKCLTPEQNLARQQAGQQAADELRQIRALPTDQK
jgi:hypothetical protein